MNQQDLMAEQLDLELEMEGLGISRFRKQQEYADKHSIPQAKPADRALIAMAIPVLSEAIQIWIDEAKTSKAGRRHSAVKFLTQLESTDVMAFVTLRTLLECISNKRNVQNIAITIGKAIEDEVRYAWYEEQAPGYFKALKEYSKKKTKINRHNIFTINYGKQGFAWKNWSTTDKFHVGMVLMDLAIQYTGYFDRVVTPTRMNNTPMNLNLTKRTQEWIGRRVERHSVLCPVYLPTVIKPKPWTGPIGGGYHHQILNPLKLVKTSNHAYLEELEGHDMPQVYRAINTIQDTPWRINTKVLDVLEQVWNIGGGVAGLPSAFDREIPPAPSHLDPNNKEAWTEEDRQTWNEWRWSAKKVYTHNVRLASKRLNLLKIRWVADKFRNYDRIYFPHQLDFRGRLYAVPNYLHPQGDDTAKGLLTFAEGKPIETRDQMEWLAIHGANCWGEDKCSLDQRVHWVRDNTDQILACADDPIENLWWTDADKPFQFLAWCFEWAGFLGHGYGYVSHLPISMDGSCNGLQIFSLILRDKVGGKATNLLPTDAPQDIYQIVADKVVDRINDMLKYSSDPEELIMANLWKNWGINRKATKRQVMVVPYGGTFRSCQEYTMDYIRDRIEDGDECPFGEDYYAAGIFLAKLIWKVISETVVSARMCMEWLQKVARTLSKQDLPVYWTTPVGFPVCQAYPEMKSRRVSTKLGDSILKLTIRTPSTKKLDKVRQANGISPNFVHSLDASALIVSVVKCLDKGVNSFAMVHDSYGTHAADAPVLSRCLREAFVELFGGVEILKDFLEQVKPLLGDKVDKIPQLPAPGNLEVNKVLESRYFFA